MIWQAAKARFAEILDAIEFSNEEYYAMHLGPCCPRCYALRTPSGCRIKRGDYLGVVNGHRSWTLIVECRINP